MLCYDFAENRSVSDDILVGITTCDTIAIMHTHTFYEIMVILEGEVKHYINGHTEMLHKGDVLFIRSNDVHNMEICSKGGRFINLYFQPDVLNRAVSFMDAAHIVQQMLRASDPPHIHIDDAFIAEIHDQYITYRDKQHKKHVLYRMLCDLLVSGFLPLYQYIDDPRPHWMRLLCEKMNTPDNLRAGVQKMQDLSGKSNAYLCRTFRTYMNCSPTEFINILRINRAAAQLLYTHDSIIDVIMDSGIESVSYFYSLFKKKVGLSPNEYRKKYSGISYPSAKSGSSGEK